MTPEERSEIDRALASSNSVARQQGLVRLALRVRQMTPAHDEAANVPVRMGIIDLSARLRTARFFFRQGLHVQRARLGQALPVVPIIPPVGEEGVAL